jgi:TonB family protein
MNSMRWASVRDDSSQALAFSFLLALTLEFFVFVILGINHLHSPTPTLTAPQETHYLETEIVQLPEQARLIEEKPATKVPLQKEISLSKVPGRGKDPQPGQIALEEDNQTENGNPLSEDHGPIAIIAPHPVIPNELKDHEFKTHVVIDFYVNTEGLPNPRLVASSENQELDAIALETAQNWRFRPAEKDKKAIAARVRLRIVFAVE